MILSSSASWSRYWCCVFAIVWSSHCGYRVHAAGNFDFGEGKVCPNYRCGKGLTPVPKVRAVTKFTSQGCGAIGGGMMMNMGSLGKVEPYAMCCDLFHACYQTCGAPKGVCDHALTQCIDTKCQRAPDAEECKKSGNLNTMMIKLGGCEKYSTAQHQACDCRDAATVTEKRTAVVTKFYQKFAPHNVEKVAGLMSKVDTSGKLATLIRKLTTKYYPQTIQKIEDESTKMYEDMMKKAAQKSDTVKKEEQDTSSSSTTVEEEEEMNNQDEEEEEVQEL